MKDTEPRKTAVRVNEYLEQNPIRLPVQLPNDYMELQAHGQPLTPAPQGTPMELLKLALSGNCAVEVLSSIMQLQREWEANEARKAFVVAMAAFKANPPEVIKDKHVKFGTTEYDHASLDHASEVIAAALAKHGIYHRWEIKQDSGRIFVTCILTHVMGHSERTTMDGPADTSGSKNAIQAIASATAYLERYTLHAATGIAAKGTDNDGRTTMGELAEHLTRIEAARDLAELKRQYDKAYAKAKAEGDREAIKALVEAKDKCKAALEAQKAAPEVI